MRIVKDAIEMLNFDKAWYIMSMRGVLSDPIQWVSMHRHLGTKKMDGWYLLRGKKCSVCGMKFPTKLLGMMNMMNGLETRRSNAYP